MNPKHSSCISGQNNSMYIREECPNCHFSYTKGFSNSIENKCPSCKHIYKSGDRVNHGPGCSICSSRTCGANNSLYKNGCPAIMSDGRFITNYNSSNELTEEMRKLNKIKSPNEFRLFLQNNGDKFMEAERNHLLRNNSCAPKIACSQGWYDLWTQNNGNWSNFDKLNCNN
ncbi:hypothetical protein QJ850_gp482 [Acanthamoeba polyphaga mimivirus]|uniref:Zn-finger domain-containing protein n=1 Tax=Acanthamoeba polyphaga mimivirus Kroon TaxID=3069720 RepID=A0A0G2Y8R3_9VIRU|nr:hypothetical protein QJ850_gp482 [Acanthamoeba polyphaga mimivirus]AKI80217.1 hypothetical protein [Acanthamoeba polyphaga mimivirus Kroon]